MAEDNTAEQLEDEAAPDEVAVEDASNPASTEPGKATSTWLKATRWEIAERRMRCERLRMQGLGMEAIAKILKVSIATVSNDLKVVKDENKSRITKFERDSFVGEGIARFEELEKRAWMEYHATKDQRMRFRALDLIRNIQSDKFDALISCGVLQPDQKPQQIQHTHTLQLDWSEEMRAKVARTLLEQSLQTQLAEPTAEDHMIEAVVEPVAQHTEPDVSSSPGSEEP